MNIQKDPYKCLRISSISIGIWNIIYSVLQFGLLGWQVQVVKQIQWEYENRQLPATGAIDAYQARFPGLYAIYTETPDRRRINAMFAIVLICLGLNIAYFASSVSMLYGTITGKLNWILPWFFIAAPTIMMCTAYSILWWSGDVFNENLTFSVAEFVMTLAINGACFIVIMLYYFRLRGKLSPENLLNKPCEQMLPEWNLKFPDKPPKNIQKKIIRRERRSNSAPKNASNTRHHNHGKKCIRIVNKPN